MQKNFNRIRVEVKRFSDSIPVRNLFLGIIFFLGLMFAFSNEAHPIYPQGEFKTDSYHQFWFLYQSEKREGQKEFIFRPFYSRYSESISGYSYTTSLYPVYAKQETPHWAKWSFLFIFDGNYVKHPDYGEDRDTTFGPFYRSGKGDTDRENYTAIFPFYGKIKSAFSWSEVGFVLWPIYTYWSHKDFKAHSVLWPFTVYGKGLVRKEYRIFPFYSYKSHTGKYRRSSILWPFYQSGEMNLDKKEPYSYRLYFPFYGYKSSLYGNMKSYTLLYLPFALFAYGYDKRVNSVEYRFLFGFFQFGRSNDKDYHKLIFFPFYGYSHFASKESTFITPFYFRMKSDTYHMKSDYLFLVPFYIRSLKHYIKEDRRENYYKLWPLFRYHKDSEGNLFWNTLTLFPIKSIHLERIWDPIFSIVEYSKYINGEKRLSLLVRLYTQRWSKEEFHLYIPLLLDFSIKEENKNWEVLYGLIGYERKGEGKKFKLFWFLEL
ncbi:MAG: hypothetical protein H7A25_16835 [Leptospiraceae bacterium]|nr:hypothetical protein [Leptospiraceae bacterium]MCP5501570.1 hypothetical protein [Leptospiraceae bacterium]